MEGAKSTFKHSGAILSLPTQSNNQETAQTKKAPSLNELKKGTQLLVYTIAVN